MNDAINGGGPAFPNLASGFREADKTGMTLRDYFAGLALPQAVEDYGVPGTRGREDHGQRITPYSAKGVGTREQIITRQAYVYADAMLEARK